MPGTSYENNRNRTFSTRHERARAAIPNASVRDSGALADWRSVLQERRASVTPIERFQLNANLLSPKSAFSTLLTAPGRPTFPITPTVESSTTPAEENPIEMLERKAAAAEVFDDILTRRLNKQYVNYELEGLAHFKERNWIRARDCFDICRSLDRKNPWPLAIDTLVALETNDVSRAVNSLVNAINRIETLEDIKLDKNSLYGEAHEFEKTIDTLNLMASNDPTGQPQFGHLLLSYCAWLNDDIATAASAAQTAAKSMPEELQESVMRYADMLKEQAANPGGQAN